MNDWFGGSGAILGDHSGDEQLFCVILSYFGLSFCMNDRFRLSGAILVAHTDDELPFYENLIRFGRSFCR